MSHDLFGFLHFPIQRLYIVSISDFNGEILKLNVQNESL